MTLDTDACRAIAEQFDKDAPRAGEFSGQLNAGAAGIRQLCDEVDRLRALVPKPPACATCGDSGAIEVDVCPTCYEPQYGRCPACRGGA